MFFSLVPTILVVLSPFLACTRTSSSVQGSGQIVPVTGSYGVCARALPVVRPFLGSLSRKPVAIQGTPTLWDLVPQVREIRAAADLGGDNCCTAQVFAKEVIKIPQFAAFCRLYLEEFNSHDQCATPASGLALTGSGSEPGNFKSYTDALAACSRYLWKMAQPDPGPIRPQLTLDEARSLRDQGKLAFHITRRKNLPNIMRDGLDPSLGGGRGGLCQMIAPPNNDSSILAWVGRTESNVYKQRSRGYVHFVINPDWLGPLLSYFDFSKIEESPSILMIRLEGISNDVERDPDTPNGGFRTKKRIRAEDLLEMPEKSWGEFLVR